MTDTREILETIGSTVTIAADRMKKKTDEMISVTRLKGRQSAMLRQVNGIFKEIGQLVFENYENGEELPEDLEGLCTDIEDLKKAIQECDREVARIRGVKICPVCGSELLEEANFCMKCGKPMGEEKAEEETEEDTVEETAEDDQFFEGFEE